MRGISPYHRGVLGERLECIMIKNLSRASHMITRYLLTIATDYFLKSRAYKRNLVRCINEILYFNYIPGLSLIPSNTHCKSRMHGCVKRRTCILHLLFHIFNESQVFCAYIVVDGNEESRLKGQSCPVFWIFFPCQCDIFFGISRVVQIQVENDKCKVTVVQTKFGRERQGLERKGVTHGKNDNCGI